MTPKYLLILLLTLVATNALVEQNEDDIPLENDNQFPPDSNSDLEAGRKEIEIEGSGDGDEEPNNIVGSNVIVSPLENIDVETTTTVSNVSEDKFECPDECSCSIEGGSENYVTDCSNKGLAEFPAKIDSRTTVLNIQGNKLTEIPKEISSLKSLKVFKANNNEIMGLATGSVSELPELEVLNLAENRLIEYSQDLRNSFTLTKLRDLDLGGNDIRTALTVENFSNFKSLHKLTLPASAKNLAEELCSTLKENLEMICIEACDKKSIDCSNLSHNFKEEEELLGVASVTTEKSKESESVDPAVNSENEAITTEGNIELETVKTETPETKEPTTDGSLTKSNQVQPSAGIVNFHAVVEDAKSVTPETITEPEPTVKIGATTKETKTGGVDKSVIGIIIAGMVVVVAGITIKKNWSSIKKRFSSSSRTPNEAGNGTNGTAPEEVPLQNKSPV